MPSLLLFFLKTIQLFSLDLIRTSTSFSFLLPFFVFTIFFSLPFPAHFIAVFPCAFQAKPSVLYLFVISSFVPLTISSDFILLFPFFPSDICSKFWKYTLGFYFH